MFITALCLSIWPSLVCPFESMELQWWMSNRDDFPVPVCLSTHLGIINRPSITATHDPYQGGSCIFLCEAPGQDSLYFPLLVAWSLSLNLQFPAYRLQVVVSFHAGWDPVSGMFLGNSRSSKIGYGIRSEFHGSRGRKLKMRDLKSDHCISSSLN